MTQRTFTIRDARAGERGAIAGLTRRAYAEYAGVMAPEAWRGLAAAIERALASDEPVERIVAVDERMLIGSVMLFPPAANAYGGITGAVPWPEVRLLAVAPEARGRYVARGLMDECIARAKAGGASALGIHTSQSMAAAMAMYRGLGFERVPEHDFQPPGAELVEGYRLRLV